MHKLILSVVRANVTCVVNIVRLPAEQTHFLEPVARNILPGIVNRLHRLERKTIASNHTEYIAILLMLLEARGFSETRSHLHFPQCIVDFENYLFIHPTICLGSIDVLLQQYVACQL